MKNLTLFIILVTILIIIGGFFINEVKKEKSIDASPITTHEYFWSETCPHCAEVSKFMENWERKDQFDLQKFEVGKSASNAKLLIARGLNCKIDQKDLGVPLLVTPQGQCVEGNEPIIQYLESLDL